MKNFFKKRPLCVLTIIIILIICGLYYNGIVLFNYKGNTDGEFIATIISEPETKQYVKEYTAKIDGKKFVLYIPKSLEEFMIGDTIYIEGDYLSPTNKRNEGGFDYSLYMKTKKIYGTFKVTSARYISSIKQEKNILKKTNLLWKKFIINIRNSIKENLKKGLKLESASLLEGLLIGDKSEIPESIIDNFRDASLSHILAISGAHFSYIILILTFLSKKLKHKRLGQTIMIILIFFFMNLTGNTPSVIRAGIMNLLIIIESMIYRRGDFWTNLSISVIIQIVINPYSIFDMGFILSYAGVIGIVLFYQIIYDKIKIKILSVTLSANIIIIPIMMYNFNIISTSFIISNILASILLGPIIILGFISNIIKIKPIYFILEMLLTLLSKNAEICAHLPLAKIYVKTPNIVSIIIFYVLILYALKTKTKDKNKSVKPEKNRKILIVMAIILIILLNQNYELITICLNKNLIINFIDVGQGDSTLIRIKDKSIMIDSGGNTDTKSSYDVGKNTVLPYLLYKHITKLDYIMISHFDADHCQGFLYVMKNIKVKNMIISKQAENSELFQEFLKIAKKRNINLIYVKAGDNIKIETITINILHPQEELLSSNPLNNNAIVCKLKYNSFSMLFTGDIEQEAEDLILSKEYNLKSTILKVGHHGSKTSTKDEFLKSVSPKIAIIGVGKNNKFGHPSDETIQKLKAAKVKIYRTDLNGEITITVSKSGKIVIKSEQAVEI